LSARLSDGAVRCQGANIQGEFGLGHKMNVMAIEAGDVPAGGVVTRLAARNSRTCATFANGAARCWGRNSVGALGYGHQEILGDEEGEMPTPELELGGEVVDLSLGADFTCALFAGDAIRCWGHGALLGYGNNESLGDDPGEMPTPLVPVF
jgi:hypothetical protein